MSAGVWQAGAAVRSVEVSGVEVPPVTAGAGLGDDRSDLGAQGLAAFERYDRDEYGWYVVHRSVNWWAVLVFGLYALVLVAAVVWVVWS